MGHVTKKVFKPLYTSDARYHLLTGGRGSLKSTTVHEFIARLTYEQGHGILFTRYTMSSAELSIIPEFENTLERLGIRSHFRVKKTKAINLKTGSFIYFSGIKTSQGDQTGRLKSIAGITTWVVEEGEDFNDEETFNTIDLSIRSTIKQNRIIWIMNPTTKEHFIYKKFIKDTNKKIEVQGYEVTVSAHYLVNHIHVTYHIAEELGYLAESWLAVKDSYYEKQIKAIDRAKKRLRGKELEREIHNIKHTSQYYYLYVGGWLEKMEGAIFPNWSEGEFNKLLPSCVGLDWGYSPDPLAALRIAVEKKRKLIYVQQLIYETEVNDIPRALSEAGISKREAIICDVGEERTRRRSVKAGYNMKKAHKKMIVDDIREINEYELIVDPNSSDLKTELNHYVWNDKKASVPIDDFNHLMDAMRYGYNFLQKKPKGLRFS